MKAWIRKRGKTYHVWWRDPITNEIKSKSVGRSKKLAENFRNQVHAQIVSGQIPTSSTATGWKRFRDQYDRDVVDQMDAGNARECRVSLGHFERLCKPAAMTGISGAMIDRYKAARSKEPSPRGGTIKPSTVNKELRYIRAALLRAHEWGQLKQVPRVRPLRAPEKLPTYVSPEQFGKLYEACDLARLPRQVQGIEPRQWWRSLLACLYMTGWRINQLLLLEWEQVDLEAGTVLALWETTKGKRDEWVHIHPEVITHLQAVRSFDDRCFPWPHDRRTLWSEFGRIRDAAKVTCTGFHDLRRGFATENAEHLDLFELQQLMQHRSLDTTRKYVNMASRLKRSIPKLRVPDALKRPENESEVDGK